MPPFYLADFYGIFNDFLAIGHAEGRLLPLADRQIFAA